MKLVVAAALALLAACQSAPTPAPAPAPVPAPVPVASVPPAPAPAATKPGDKCSDAIACSAGQTCVSYRGIAGARGPLFQSCEIPCRADSDCGDGRHCKVIADGPGSVCR